MKNMYSGLVKLFFGISFLCFCTTIWAQGSYARDNFWSNVRYGGGLGLGFGNGTFNASVAPSAIYQWNNQFATGMSLSFNYAKFNENTLFAYGGSVISLYNPIHFLQLSVELEQLRVNRTLNLLEGSIEDNYWSPALFLGIGYTSYNITFGLRYDVLYNENKSIYTNALMPFIRVYF